MPLILDPFRTASSPQTAFYIYPGKQLTLQATGLSGTDKVVVEILELSTAPAFPDNECCQRLPVDVQVIRRTPLLCPDGTEAVLSATYPVGVLTGPQMITLGVRVVADPAAVIHVYAHETIASGPCTLCICDREVAAVPAPPPAPAPVVYCPSLRLSCCGEQGFGFHQADPPDPAATVLMEPCSGDVWADTAYIYPTAGVGHTIKIVDCDGTVIGYAANRSACASEDCGCTEPL